MNGLLEDGLGLMVLGMGFVFLFLIILIFATGYMSSLLNHFFPEPLPAAVQNNASAVAVDQAIDPELAVVITAAVHEHRNSKNV